MDRGGAHVKICSRGRKTQKLGINKQISDGWGEIFDEGIKEGIEEASSCLFLDAAGSLSCLKLRWVSFTVFLKTCCRCGIFFNDLGANLRSSVSSSARPKEESPTGKGNNSFTNKTQNKKNNKKALAEGWWLISETHFPDRIYLLPVWSDSPVNQMVHFRLWLLVSSLDVVAHHE